MVRHDIPEDILDDVDSLIAEVVKTYPIDESYNVSERCTDLAPYVNGLLGKTAGPVYNSRTVHPDDLATVVLHATAAGEAKVVSLIMCQLAASATWLNTAIFEDLVLPFIGRLMPELRGLCGLALAPWSLLVNAMLMQFIARFVQQRPLPWRGTWTRAQVGCACDDCDVLNDFLASPTQSVGRFPLDREGREHLRAMLDASCTGYVHHTVHIGIPSTLIVCKGRSLYARQLSAWNERKRKASRGISKWLDQKIFREVFGDEAWVELTKMNMAYFQHTVNAPTSGLDLGAGAGTKRKAEDDLEADDDLRADGG